MAMQSLLIQDQSAQKVTARSLSLSAIRAIAEFPVYTRGTVDLALSFGLSAAMARPATLFLLRCGDERPWLSGRRQMSVIPSLKCFKILQMSDL